MNHLVFFIFRRVRKMAKRDFVTSGRQSVHVEQLGSHWTDIYEIWHLNIFRKSVEKTKTNMMGSLYEHPRTFIIHRWILLRIKNVFRQKLRRKITTHILCSPPPPPRKACRLRENVEKCATARQATYDDVMRRRREALCMPVTKAEIQTHTCIMFNTYCVRIN
jgi:hypothetical protein